MGFKHWRIVQISVALTVRDCCHPKIPTQGFVIMITSCLLFLPLWYLGHSSPFCWFPCFSSAVAFPCLCWTHGALYLVSVSIHGSVCAECLYFSHCCSFSVYCACSGSQISREILVGSLLQNVSLDWAFKSVYPWPINKRLDLVWNVHSWTNQLASKLGTPFYTIFKGDIWTARVPQTLILWAVWLKYFHCGYRMALGIAISSLHHSHVSWMENVTSIERESTRIDLFSLLLFNENKEQDGYEIYWEYNFQKIINAKILELWFYWPQFYSFVNYFLNVTSYHN